MGDVKLDNHGCQVSVGEPQPEVEPEKSGEGPPEQKCDNEGQSGKKSYVKRCKRKSEAMQPAQAEPRWGSSVQSSGHEHQEWNTPSDIHAQLLGSKLGFRPEIEFHRMYTP